MKDIKTKIFTLIIVFSIFTFVGWVFDICNPQDDRIVWYMFDVMVAGLGLIVGAFYLFFKLVWFIINYNYSILWFNIRRRVRRKRVIKPGWWMYYTMHTIDNLAILLAIILGIGSAVWFAMVMSYESISKNGIPFAILSFGCISTFWLVYWVNNNQGFWVRRWFPEHIDSIGVWDPFNHKTFNDWLNTMNEVIAYQSDLDKVKDNTKIENVKLEEIESPGFTGKVWMNYAK